MSNILENKIHKDIENYSKIFNSKETNFFYLNENYILFNQISQLEKLQNNSPYEKELNLNTKNLNNNEKLDQPNDINISRNFEEKSAKNLKENNQNFQENFHKKKLNRNNSNFSESSTNFTNNINGISRFLNNKTKEILKENFLKLEEIFIKNPKFKYYNNKGSLILDRDDAVENKPTEKEIKNSIKVFFDKSTSNGSMIFLMGAGSNTDLPANLIIETKEGERFLFYKEIFDMWVNRKSKKNNKKLLIIIDACYSGMWVQENIYNLHFCVDIGISIQATCLENQSCKDHKKFGSLFLNLFIGNSLFEKKYNETYNFFRCLAERREVIDQNPVSIGWREMLNKDFNFEIGFDTWKDCDFLGAYQEVFQEEKVETFLDEEDDFKFYIGK